MTTDLSDERLDGLVRRYLGARRDRTLGLARSAEAAARLGREHLDGRGVRAARRSGPTRQLTFALLLGGALAATAAGFAIVGSPRSVGLQTEETGEPGVVRVLGDGIRELSPDRPDGCGLDLSIGADGTMWVARCWDVDPAQEQEQLTIELYRLEDPVDYSGRVPIRPTRHAVPRSLDVAPDGSILALGPDGELRWFDGTTVWSMRSGVAAFDLAPDGQPWIISEAGMVGALEDPSHVQLPEDLSGRWHELEVVAAIGNGWVFPRTTADEVPARLYHVIHGWDKVTIENPVGIGPFLSLGGVDVASDGTTWAMFEAHEAYDAAAPRDASGGDTGADRAHPYLVRYRGDAISVFDESDGVPRSRGETHRGALRATPDGHAWMAACDGSQCSGVASFDGTTWTHHLPGIHPMDLEIAPDGSIWVVEGLPIRDNGLYEPGAVYRIDPAIAAGPS